MRPSTLPPAFLILSILFGGALHSGEASFAAPEVNEALRLPSLVSDGMVIQRNTTVRIWGWTEPGHVVTVEPSWSEESVRATAALDGRWAAPVRSPDAGGPHSIVLRCGDEMRVIRDVLSGEVWVCSGQSNMEWRMSWLQGNESDIAAAHHPRLRLIEVPKTISASPRDDFAGQWTTCSPEVAGGFTAVGYYFSRALLRELDVPIGLISSSWGGTPAEAWAAPEYLEEFPQFEAPLTAVRAAAADAERFAAAQAERMKKWRSAVDAKDPGIAGRWADPTTDVSEWEQATLPGNWEAAGHEGFDGLFWYRRTIDIPESWRGEPLTLSLGPVDDFDVTWIHGKRVGGLDGAGDWRSPRTYTVPADQTVTSPLTIAVRVHDPHGGGGFHGKPEAMFLQHGPETLSLAGDWFARPATPESQLPKRPPATGFNSNTPTVLYQGMIAPLLRNRIAGAIWYQGESNQTRARQYRRLFPKMIESWREAWGQGDFPFYFVQIAPFGYGGRPESSAELREAQFMTLDAVPNAGIAVTMDIGDLRDIHPRNKLDVGERLARWALHQTYGRTEVVPSGPIFRRQTIEPGRIRLHFDHAVGLATRDDQPLTHFRIAGADRQYHDATGRIDGSTIVVSSPKVKNPVAVRFAFTDTAEPNLVNGAGLPASSFRTEDW
ncbi:MAG: sialate O-acetylesterase [Planctomycetota bacterium]